MAQPRKKASRKHGASRAGTGGRPAWIWFAAGFALGVAVSGLFLSRGMLQPAPESAQTPPSTQNAPEPALIAGPDASREGQGSRFDFFTVLPEMEVVVPEQELAAESAPSQAQDTSGNRYMLQVGSFRNLADADQLKARLALLGTQASIQVVTVNDTTWHRVRIGPVQGARRADEMRRMLLDQDIETIVLKDNS